VATTNTSSAAIVDTVVESRADVAPQLRTLLLTDLCNSTELVEKLGDARSAELFQAHDRLVLELQRRWRARLIDRSDGLLLLFERAVDGLGFALDYVRGLRDLGKEHGTELQARAGLHVGEVLTWQNSSEAVNLGAKPLEVEGLAKPMAARLMTLARPGQVLVSAVAEPLAHRAARELGPRGEQLLWKSWGRWRFKGVPGAQEIFEVGEAGLAPLRVPRNGPKAWRDIPLWRRPPALVAEAAVLAGLAVGTWFATRPQPAIAFAERDWVVVGDLRNVTGDARLDDALEQAFRISLEQSRYVNVLSDLKARDTLGRMQRPANTTLDRAIASEIALRDGARAVILPTVAEVGGHLRVSAEVIDPHTQTTVYAAYADGKGAGSALASVDDVTEELRQKLGEALASVQKDSEPLPQVTTSNLDALKAFALGQQAYARSQYADAMKLYAQATDLDPQFALAWVAQAKANFAMLNASAAMAPLKRAQALRSRLAPREALYLDGWSAELEAPVQALDRWKLMAKLYPDAMNANGNAAIRLERDGQWAAAIPYAQHAALPQSDVRGFALSQVARSQTAQGDIKAAIETLGQAIASGDRVSYALRARAFAVLRHFDDAEADLRRGGVEPVDADYLRTAFFIDQGRFPDASRAAENVDTLMQKTPDDSRPGARLSRVAAEYLAGDSGAASRNLNALAKDLENGLPSSQPSAAQEDIGVASNAAEFAVRLGDPDLAQRLLDAAKGRPEAALTDNAVRLAVVHARLLLSKGQAKQAIEELQARSTPESPISLHAALMDAQAQAGNLDAAIQEARWLQAHRGLAYSEQSGYSSVRTLNVAQTTLAFLQEAEWQSKLGRSQDAQKALAAFDARWPISKLPDYLRKRRDAFAAASSMGGF
jgi:putative peptide modification system cyclase